MLRHKRAFNHKRAIRTAPATEPETLELARLAAAVGYSGNPLHKVSPGDFRLTPPNAARPGKTLCDDVRLFRRSDVLKLLRQGAKCGLVSVHMRDGWPQNIWAVAANGRPLEAMYDGTGGTYHGYPMAEDDPLGTEVKRRWAECRTTS